jgi:predicted deacylase
MSALDRLQPRQYPSGTKTTVKLDVAPLATGQTLQLAVHVIRGAKPGKTLVVLAGVHGDEYAGVEAIRQLNQSLDPAEMSGDIIAVPVANPPAFATHTRTSPLDGQNLARVFPGKETGTVSEQIAYLITHSVSVHADFLIDLHTGGSHMEIPLLVGYPMGDSEQSRTARAAAERFGVPVIWGHNGGGIGRSLSEPHERGVPWLYTEAPESGWLHPEQAAVYAEGVRNVARYLGIVPGEAPLAGVTHDLAGDGDLDWSLTTPAAGYLVSKVNILDRVAKGDVLGVVETIAGEPLTTIVAPTDGVLVTKRRSPSVNAGDLLYYLT